MTIWKQLSTELEAAAQTAGQNILGLAGARRPGAATLIKPGLAVSALHLMGQNDEGRLIGHDGDVYAAKIVGRDALSDLVLLKTDAPGDGLASAAAPALGTLTLAVTRRRGQIALTSGVVSERDGAFVTRSGGAFAAYIDVDASLPRGFSGGALLGPDGGMLGVNTHGLTRGGTTIDSASVMLIADALAQHGEVGRGHLGVQVRRGARGTLVTGAQPGGPAHAAGLEAGDIITTLDGRETPSPAALMWALTDKAERTVSVAFRREGEAQTLDVLVQKRPATRRGRHRRKRRS